MSPPSKTTSTPKATKRKSPSSNTTPASSKRPRTTTAKSATAEDGTKNKSGKLKFKSPAEFFAENKNIAGFDNPGKSLYTTIRELVENALDAAEAVDTLPDISVHIERIDRMSFKTLVGMDSRDRVDHSLYKDVENQKERRAREAREKREAKKKKKTEVNDTSSQQTQSQTTTPINSQQQTSQPMSQDTSSTLVPIAVNAITDRRRSSANEIFRVTVTDNGSGMAHDDVPNMMGRVLAGTKYCVRQARGKFGLGSKMALIWSKMSTGLPVHVMTSTNTKETTDCILDIDIANNVPTVLKHERTTNRSHRRGSIVSVTIEGNWSTYRAKILQYMRQMAVITPYAKFYLKFDASNSPDDSRHLEMLFARRTDIMPPHAKEVKHHPSSVNQLILKQIIANVKPDTTLVRFLANELESIPSALAVRLVNELGPDFTSHLTVSKMNLNHIRQIDALLHEARFDPPDGKCLSPAGEYNLRLGITKELKPTLVATHEEPADVFEGHPFIVEAGVALGGTGLKTGITVYRFANRIPLLFEGGNDVVTKTVREDIKWGNYKISTNDRVGVICSIVSTKIPFKGTGKEYIGDDAETIKASVKRAITQCCLQLKAKLVRRIAQRDAAERKKNITKYAPDVVNAVMGVLKEVGDNVAPAAKDVVQKIQGGKISKQMMLNKLLEHVQQIDKEQAIEYAAATGRDQKTIEPIFVSERAKDDDLVYLDLGTMSGVDGEKTSAPPLRFALSKSLQSAI